jgi:hyperosmotically inducible periplasmic protein
MLSGLLKLIVVVVVIVAAGVFFLGWNLDRRNVAMDDTGRAVGTAGETAAGEARQAADRAADTGRQVGAEVGQRVGQAADAASRALADGSLTAKIKSKMALDDTVKALNLDVDTERGVVTVKGYVRSEAERTRALQLARETEGVSRVVDGLRVR